MATKKNNIITIDTNIWTTPKILAKELGYASKRNDCTQRITNWIKRGKITSWKIDELNITLVNRQSVPDHA